MKELDIKSQFDFWYDVLIPRSAYLSRTEMVQQFSFQGSDLEEYEIQKQFIVSKQGLFTGFKGWFGAQLTHGVVLDIESGDDTKNKTPHWKSAYLPIEFPLDVKVGDIVDLTYSRSKVKGKNSIFRQRYTWCGTVTRNGDTILRFSQTTC